MLMFASYIVISFTLISQTTTLTRGQHKPKTIDYKNFKESGIPLVDKSNFIKDVMLEGSQSVLITRPRGFGKSINLSMLKYFFDNTIDSKKLFYDTSISSETNFCSEYQNKYPVLCVSFPLDNYPTFESAFDALKNMMRDLYRQHSYVKKILTLFADKKQYSKILNKSGNESGIVNALKVLIEYIRRYHNQRVILLVDNYDSFTNTGYFRGYYEKISPVITQFLKSVVNNCPNLRKAILVGVTPLAIPGVYNIEVYSVFDERFSRYFGFERKDVKKLIPEYVTFLTKSEADILLNRIMKYYEGYSIGSSIILNPFSVAACLKRAGALKDYWPLSEERRNFFSLMKLHGFLPILQSQILLKDLCITSVLDNNLKLLDKEANENSFWTVLTHLGYLTVANKTQTNETKTYLCRLKIPNKEVEITFVSATKQYFERHDKIPNYNMFLSYWKNENFFNVKKCIQNYIDEVGGFQKWKSLFEFETFFKKVFAGLANYYSSITSEWEGKALIFKFKGSQELKDLDLVVTYQQDNQGLFKRMWMKLCNSLKQVEKLEHSACNGFLVLEFKINE